MSDHRSLGMPIRVLLVLCCLLLPSSVSCAKLVSARDYRNGILDAELLVIVSQESASSFRVEEAFLGSANRGDSIELPGFRLFTEQQNGPDIVEPITPDTRILLFLRHKKEVPAAWEPTDFGYSFFWVQNPEQVLQLRKTAEQAIALRRRWEEAANTPDPRHRAEALWPFLSTKDYGPSFLEHTKSALQKIAPISGDYISERFDDMPHLDRMNVLADAGAYGGDKLHQKLRSYIKAQQELYESSVSAYKLNDHNALASWNTMPESVKDIYGEIYYGLAGLASFQRRDDLPVIREIARWAVKYGLEQTCEAALAAFRTMPDKDNLAVISLIWERFPMGSGEGDEVFHVDVIRALCAHKYVQTVPLLAPFVTDGFAGAEVQAALTAIVGQDLGEKPEPWLAWYGTPNKPRHQNQSPY
jgi:hypothetical protein